MEHTSTLGVRQHPVTRTALSRGWTPVEVEGRLVRIKIGHDATGIRQVNPEFDDVRKVAAETGLSEREVLDRARALARGDGLVVGAVVLPAPLALARARRSANVAVSGTPRGRQRCVDMDHSTHPLARDPDAVRLLEHNLMDIEEALGATPSPWTPTR